MKLPRDISAEQLISRLSRYGYAASRQTGSHIRLVSTLMGSPHYITIPAHKTLKSGTLNAIIRDIASYLKKSKQDFQGELFS